MKKFVWFVCSVLFANGMHAQPSAEEVVLHYLIALRSLDQQQMNRWLADSAISRSISGSESFIDRISASNMRGFEKETKTVWRYAIKSVSGDTVTAELTEANEFYDLIGVGKRTQVDVYFVKKGLVHWMTTKSLVHANGDYANSYRTFKNWILTTPAAQDAELVNNKTLLFTRRSARLMRPWLQRWQVIRKR